MLSDNVFLSLSNSIRELTQTANKFVEQNDIEQCNIALVERQKLLEKLCDNLPPSSEMSSEFNDQLLELLTWVQGQDKYSSEKLMSKRQENMSKSIKQQQTRKALKHYNNLL